MSPPSSWDGPAGGRRPYAAEDRQSVRQAVVDVVRTRPEVAADPDRLDGYLRDVCPSQPAAVAVVVVAARSGVAEELAGTSEGQQAEAAAARVARRLNAEAGIDHALARWAVDTWAVAVGSAAPPAPPMTTGPAEHVPSAPAAGPTSLPPTVAPVPEVLSAEAPRKAAPAPPSTGGDAEVLQAMVVRRPPAPAAAVVESPEPPEARPAPSAPAPMEEPLGRTVQRPSRPAPAPVVAPGAPTRRRRTIALGAVAAVVCVFLVALVAGLAGGGGGTGESGTGITSLPTPSTGPPTPSSTAAPITTVTVAPRPFPSQEAALAAGAYATTKFRPRLTTNVGDGWTMFFESAEHLQLNRTDSATEIVSVLRAPRPLRRDGVFATYADAAMTTATEPPPADLIAWLRTNSRLRVSAATPVTKAGTQAVQVDVSVVSGYESAMCGPGCTPLFQLDGSVFWLAPGTTNRMYVLSVGGQQIAVVIEAQADQFGSFVQEADRLVDAIAFTG